jgi:hypothetical protein
MRIVAISTAAATVLVSTGAAFALDSIVTMTPSMSPTPYGRKSGTFAALAIGIRRLRIAC